MADSADTKADAAKKNPHAVAKKNDNLLLLCLISAIDGADLQLLPASFRALEVGLNLTPSKLSLMAVCQGCAMTLSGPIWGAFADNGAQRRLLLAFGVFSWGVITLLLAFITELRLMIMLRILNGFFLGCLTPLVQSMVAEEPVADTGFYFGLLEFSRNGIGQMVTLLVATALSTRTVLGTDGWRICFAAVGLMSIMLSALVLFFMQENTRPWTPERIGFTTELRKFGSYLSKPTFGAIVAQGMFGSIPWSALTFTTLYFQYVGMPDVRAGSAVSMLVLGSAFGGMFGGWLGDKMAKASPDHGRIAVAQASVLLGIPFILAMFLAVPREPNTFVAQVCLCMGLGFFSHWCACGCNRPIFLEIVRGDCVASVIAWDSALEATSGQFFGPLVVSFLAESVFDYSPNSQAVSDMDETMRQENARALANAICISVVATWTVCLVFYTALHWTYKWDRAKARAEMEDASHLDETAPLKLNFDENDDGRHP